MATACGQVCTIPSLPFVYESSCSLWSGCWWGQLVFAISFLGTVKGGMLSKMNPSWLLKFEVRLLKAFVWLPSRWVGNRGSEMGHRNSAFPGTLNTPPGTFQPLGFVHFHQLYILLKPAMQLPKKKGHTMSWHILGYRLIPLAPLSWSWDFTNITH